MPDNRKPLIYGAFPVCRNYTVRAYLCNTGARKRHGCENTLRYAGPCVGGHHPGHLYPCHRGYAERGGGQNRPGTGQRGAGGIRSVGTGRSRRLPAGAEKNPEARHRVYHPDQRELLGGALLSHVAGRQEALQKRVRQNPGGV